MKALMLGKGSHAPRRKLKSLGTQHIKDEEIAEEMAEESATTRALEGGDKYGNMSFQVPLAVGWWVIGHAAGGPP